MEELEKVGDTKVTDGAEGEGEGGEGEEEEESSGLSKKAILVRSAIMMGLGMLWQSSQRSPDVKQ